MRHLQLDTEQQVEFANKAALIKFQDKPLTIDPMKLMVPRREVDHAPDLWTVFNVVQENLIKGGIAGQTATTRRMTTRSIVNLDENIRINRDMWNLAEDYLT